MKYYESSILERSPFVLSTFQRRHYSGSLLRWESLRKNAMGVRAEQIVRCWFLVELSNSRLPFSWQLQRHKLG